MLCYQILNALYFWMHFKSSFNPYIPDKHLYWHYSSPYSIGNFNNDRDGSDKFAKNLQPWQLDIL